MTVGPPEPQADPNTRPCADCGHVWFAGERRHVYVGDDEVVCILCGRLRKRAHEGGSERFR
jgi:hypothetical protein